MTFNAKVHVGRSSEGSSGFPRPGSAGWSPRVDSCRSASELGKRPPPVTVPVTTVMPSRAQREPAPVDRIATCRAPSTGTVDEAHKPDGERRAWPHSLARGLAGRSPGVALPAFCDTRGPSGFPLSHLLSHARRPQSRNWWGLTLSDCRIVALSRCDSASRWTRGSVPAVTSAEKLRQQAYVQPAAIRTSMRTTARAGRRRRSCRNMQRVSRSPTSDGYLPSPS
jgi:hypothetical protein